MREIYVDQDYTRVGFYKSVLDQAGIPNIIRNDISHSSLTELPSPVFFPALCVVHEEDYDRAMQLLREIHNARPTNLPDWRCPKCDAEIPGNFDRCWRCDFSRESATPANE